MDLRGNGSDGFRQYGPVEIAITGDDHCYGRVAGDTANVYEWRPTGEVEIDPLAGPTQVYGWFIVNQGVRAKDHRESFPVEALLDAGAVLCWFDYEQFQAAEAAMGDPHP